MSKRRRLLVVVVGMVVAACGGTTGDTTGEEGTVADTTTAQTAAPEDTATGGEAIEVRADDYVFNGLPETVEPGTELTLTNVSQEEVHEMVVVRIADEETRTVQELLELPEEETEGVVEFQGLLVALPEDEGFNPEAEGDSITVSEAGRYAVVCFIPQGADPAVVEEAMASGETEEQPDLGDGTPHAFLGMVGEFQVEG